VVPVTAVRPLLPEDVYRRAISVGRSAAGRSGPNPPVGCVIVQDGAVVAEGATEPAGGAHAEVVALAAAGGGARGATAVVTLEPCAHHGRTGPCTDALLRSGVTEVHVLVRDPDPQAGGGIERLRAAGIAVVEVAPHLPSLAALAAHDLRGFLTRVRHGRPHVTLKLAQTPEGRTDPGSERYLTGARAREQVHLRRADVDAVLVGSATVRADDPVLDVRGVPHVRMPRPVVLATTGDIGSDARVVGRGALVLVGSSAPGQRCEELERAGATVVRVAEVEGHGVRGLDIHAALAVLLEHRILTVLAEPGPRLAGTLLAAHVVDDVELHIAGAAGHAEGVVAALPHLQPLIDGWRVHDADVSVEVHDEDVLLRAPAARLDARVAPVGVR
jgi:diaminohydroxyphosphoribosylaminopyrimidine deaminase/5-amino-6-(5-phosphoribosylamino)uracil reductase